MYSSPCRSLRIGRPYVSIGNGYRCTAATSSTYQTPVPTDAVAPLEPVWPLSTRTTSAPAWVALMAAHVPAGPPPITNTSVVNVATVSPVVIVRPLDHVLVATFSGLESIRAEDDRRPDRQGRRQRPHHDQRGCRADVGLSQ